MNLIRFFTLITLIFCIACAKKPEACFSIDKNKEDIRMKQEIVFTSCSLYGEKYEWDFGDGKKADGAQVRHLFDTTGTFYVTLKVTNDSKTDQETQPFQILP